MALYEETSMGPPSHQPPAGTSLARKSIHNEALGDMFEADLDSLGHDETGYKNRNTRTFGLQGLILELQVPEQELLRHSD